MQNELGSRRKVDNISEIGSHKNGRVSIRLSEEKAGANLMF